MKKQTVKKHRCKKVPVVVQMEALECGAACLAMILAYYKKWIPLEIVRRDCGVSRDGSNAQNILKAARAYGLEAKGYRYEPEGLKEDGAFPCVIHWNFNHFVVLCGFKGEQAVINDPARGCYTVSSEEFDKAFTGICLMFQPGAEFKPSGKPKSIWKFAGKKLAGSGTAFTLVAIAAAITSLIGIIVPGFSNAFADRLLSGKSPEWFYPFIAGLSLVALLKLASEWIKTVYSYKSNGKIEVVANAEYMWHILRLPMEFFSQRMAGDIASRKSKNAQIVDRLISTFAPLMVQSAMLIFYLAVMIHYSLPLTLVGVLSVVINLCLSFYISQRRVNLTRIISRDKGRLAGTTVSGIEMIETIKVSGAENGFFEKWSGCEAAVHNGQVKMSKLNTYVGMIPQLIRVISNTLIFMGSVYLCMRGSWTIGMITAFSGLFTAFLEPASAILSASQDFQEMRTDMERIEDIMEYPAEISGENKPFSDDTEFDKLSGQIELKNVTFGYSKLDKPLIENFSLTVKPGQRIAFVGSSGSGKSTIAKLISGLYQPWNGEILFDGKPISEIDRNVFTGSLSVVDQDIILFEDTISNNIKMWDSSIEDFEMILAARDAQIHESIIEREGGYQYKLSAGGHDLSGGERQRLEIARVLAGDPTIVIMDEATSALDAKTENNVVESICNRGITCLVVAHRLSTIRDCDEIIVLEQGKVIERGTHSELMEKNGRYTKLVTNE